MFIYYRESWTMLVFIISVDMSPAILCRVHCTVMICMWGGLFLTQAVFKRQSKVWGLEVPLFSCYPEVMSLSCREHSLQFVKNRNVAEGNFCQEKNTTLRAKDEKITHRSQMSKLKAKSST